MKQFCSSRMMEVVCVRKDVGKGYKNVGQRIIEKKKCKHVGVKSNV